MDKPTLTRTISLGETTVCGFGHTLSLLLSETRFLGKETRFLVTYIA
jgi:hypothetical protein